jgi:hypothetical protein
VSIPLLLLYYFFTVALLLVFSLIKLLCVLVDAAMGMGLARCGK